MTEEQYQAIIKYCSERHENKVQENKASVLKLLKVERNDFSTLCFELDEPYFVMTALWQLQNENLIRSVKDGPTWYYEAI